MMARSISALLTLIVLMVLVLRLSLGAKEQAPF